MAKNSSLASMSVQSLLRMRDDIADVLSRKADDLKSQLSALTGGKRKVGRPCWQKAPQEDGEGRSPIPQQERPESGLVRPRWNAALDEE